MKKEEFDNKKKLVYDFVTDKEYKPMSVKEMAMVLQVPAAEKKERIFIIRIELKPEPDDRCETIHSSPQIGITSCKIDLFQTCGVIQH